MTKGPGDDEMGPGMTKKDLLQESFGDLEGDGVGGGVCTQHKIRVQRY